MDIITSHSGEAQMVEHMKRNEVTLHPADHTGTEWVCWFENDLLSPLFNSKGAAQAYLDAVVSGKRKPEYTHA